MLNGKFIATRTMKDFFEQGKVYEFKNGFVKFENERRSMQYEDIVSFERGTITFRGILKPCEQTLKEQYLLNQDVVRVVELRDGIFAFVLKDRLISKDGWFDLNDYGDDMKDLENGNKFDVNFVYESKIIGVNAWNFGLNDDECLKLVWERQEKTEKQIKKEEIEAQMRKLADELKESEVM